jgi:hypothetical protein
MIKIQNVIFIILKIVLNLIQKLFHRYNRRLTRLSETLYSDENKLLIRLMHTIDSYHPEVNGNKEKDCVEQWLTFYDVINSKYKNIN